jgi:UDP-N-acetylglucosamine 2-epimerase
MDAGSDAVSKGIRVYREMNEQDFVRWYTSLPIEQFGRLLNNASCIVGNSSSGIRESSYLGVPSVNIGNRQAGRERGENVTDVPHDAEAIKRAIVNQVERGQYESDLIYGNGGSGQKIADILAAFDFDIQKQIIF